jgi:exonuclease III
MFWNIGGFGRPTRRNLIRDYISSEGLDGIGLQETMKKDFTQRELDEIFGGRPFRWVWNESRGHSGGLLMGVKEGQLEVEDSEIGDHYVSMVLRDRASNFRWELITVYGPAQHDESQDFISELSRKCMYAVLPVVLGGDFNLIRSAKDKNNSNINQRLMDKFNLFIDLYQLKEIRSGLKYTCTNRQLSPVMVNLDRILMPTEWETRHPLCCAWSNARVGSDHWPIFLDSGEKLLGQTNHFYFEKQ